MRFLSIVKSAENQGPPPQALLDAIRSEEHTSELQSLAYLVCRLLLEKKTCALPIRSEEHTSELQSLAYLVCRLLLEKKKNTFYIISVDLLTASDRLEYVVDSRQYVVL